MSEDDDWPYNAREIYKFNLFTRTWSLIDCSSKARTGPEYEKWLKHTPPGKNFHQTVFCTDKGVPKLLVFGG